MRAGGVQQASQEQMSSEQLKQQLVKLSYFVGRELVKDFGHGNQEGEGNLFMLFREIWGSSFSLNLESVREGQREALPCRVLAPDFEMKSSPGTVVALYVMALDCGSVEKSLWKRMEE